MIAPLGYRVLIKPDPVEEVTKGGILVPETARGREQKAMSTGTLIRKGPSVGHGVELIPDGSRVAFVKYSGSEVKEFDGTEKYLIVIDEDVSAWDNPQTEE